MTPENIEALQVFLTKTLLAFGLNALGAVLILVLGWWLAGWLSRAVGAAIDRSPRVDSTLKPLAISLTRYSLLGVTLMAVLGRFGVQTTSVVAVFGAAGLAIGLALQGTLSNVAAGVMLLVLRPFKVNDIILVGGQLGTVKQIGLFITELTTPDNVYVALPNSSVWGAAITNYTRNSSRRIDLTVGIDYGDDMDKAIGLAMEVLRAEARVLEEPAPTVAVRTLGESSVDLVIRAFVKPTDFGSTTFALNKAIKERYDAEGINIPFPQRTLHLASGSVTAEA